ncbi:23 kDa integral membrane protein-like [Tetranychus urticae]|uniref:Tetraspanin n=1 Tax=Tetranychus urticae TaxID=32264 RepID=T1L0K5_TETUR|nr:23 kDa integral membrane protein-like [Tetranychus urticae]
MVKGFTNSLIQCVLFTFNFVFVCFGVIIGVLGGYFLVKSTDFKQIIDTPDTGAIVVVLTGIAVFIISFLGCFGAVKENSCLLKMYCFCVGILSILIIGPLIIFMVYSVKLDEIMEKQLLTAFTEYRVNDPKKNSISAAIDTLHQTSKCCGYNGPAWWAANLPEFEDNTVPASCCSNQITIGLMNRPQNKCTIDQVKFTQGCEGELRTILKLFFNTMITSLLIIGLTLLIAAAIACILANAARAQ